MLSGPGPGHAIRVRLLNCDHAAFDPAAFATQRIACPESIARSVRKRQAEFFFGRCAANAVLRELGVPDVEVPIGPQREPLWPSDLVGSISHSGAFAAAAVARRHQVNGIGIDIDIECIATPDEQAALCRLAVDGGEHDLLRSLAARMPADLLVTLAFSAKESLFKAAFGSVQSFFDFTAARLIDIQPSAGSLTLEIREPLGADFPRGRRCCANYRMIDADTVFTSVVW